MPCSQCRQSGHNITTCTNWISAIDPSFFLIDNVQKKQVKSYSRKVISDVPSGIVTMYHGTSLKAAMNIQKEGFNVNLCGKNGAMLGKGVYVTPAIEKAVLYANGFHKPNLYNGVILVVEVNLGKCVTLTKDILQIRNQWIKFNYDSCYLPKNIMGRKGIDKGFEEYCIRNQSHIKIKDVILGDSIEASKNGYKVKNNRLSKEIIPKKEKVKKSKKFTDEYVILKKWDIF